MKRAVVFTLLSCLLALSLLIASCDTTDTSEGTVTQEGKGQTVTTGGGAEEQDEQITGPSPEVTTDPGTPKYGGTMTLTPVLPSSQFNVFDANHIYCGSVYLTNEELISGDLAKGPSGTGETSFADGFAGQTKFMKGWLCESWELPDDQTIIYNIRQGVNWWNKAPLNGREMTADDVAWSLNKHFNSPMSYVYTSFALSGMAPESVTALDKYTVEVKLPPGVQGMWLVCVSAEAYIFPENITELVDLNDWRNAIGTAPWMLVDVVPSVSETYEKNPNYWQMDPVHPENRLPYPDRQINLTISDASTQEAAFRTGKLDRYFTFTKESVDQLMRENPDLELVTWQTSGVALTADVTNQESPWSDIRVRQALNMAVNKQELIDDYYGGDAVMLGYPIKVHKAFSSMYTPLEEMPESVRMLYDYNPERAKELMAEAGYPDGFKTSVQCSTGNADFLSILQSYFVDIGVEMEIEPLETGAWFGVWMGRNHHDFIYATLKPEHPYMFYTERPDQFWNCSFWSDPRVDEAYEKMMRVIGVNDDEVVSIMKQITPVILESAWGVFLPTGYAYNLYWPWFQGWNGEFDICYNDQGRDRTFIWIDQDLKTSMGY